MHRRKPPIYRPRNLLLGALALIIIIPLLLLYSATTATGGDSDQYIRQFAALLESAEPQAASDAQRDHPTAWDLAQQILALEQRIISSMTRSDRAPFVDYTAIWTPPPAPGQPDHYEPFTHAQVMAHTRQIMDRMLDEGLDDLLAQLAAAPRFGRPAPQAPLHQWPAADNPSSALRRLSRLNMARLKLAARAGSWPDVHAILDQSLALMQLDAAGCTIHTYMSATAQWVSLSLRLQAAIVQLPPDEPALHRLRTILDSRPLPSIKLALEGERLIALDTIERTYTQGGLGGGRFIPTEFSRLTWPEFAGPYQPGQFDSLTNLMGYGVISKRLATDLVNDFYDNTIALSDLTLPDRQAHPFDPVATRDALTWRAMPVSLSLSGAFAIHSSLTELLYLDAAHLAIALEIHRARHGTYPASLENLVPSIFPDLPRDPMHGGPYGYRLLNLRGQHTHPYILYSFGADGQDNSGSPADQPHLTLPPGEAPGTDYILSPE